MIPNPDQSDCANLRMTARLACRQGKVWRRRAQHRAGPYRELAEGHAEACLADALLCWLWAEWLGADAGAT